MPNYSIQPAPNGSGHAPTVRVNCTLAVAQAAAQNFANAFQTPMHLIDNQTTPGTEVHSAFTPSGLTQTTLAAALTPPTG